MNSKFLHKAYPLAAAIVLGLSVSAVNAMPQDAGAPVQTAEAAPAPQAAPAPEMAPQAPVAEPGSFESLDANADGGLTKEEIPADHALAKKFKKADADKSGNLNKDEFEAHRATAEAKK
jgi:EF hand